MANIIKLSISIGLSIILFYFLITCIILPKNASEIPTNDSLLVPEVNNGNQSAQKELEEYASQLLYRSSKDTNEIANYLKFKKVSNPIDNQKEGLLNNLLKSATSIKDLMPKAPELENFNDYAPVSLPITNQKPILPSQKITPNYLTLNKDTSTPLPVNEYEPNQPANFGGEYRVPWNGKMSDDSLNNFFKNNPSQTHFKNFDEIGRADVVDAVEWEKIAKKKENESPLLSQKCMKPEQDGFMPSNHYNINKLYQNF